MTNTKNAIKVDFAKSTLSENEVIKRVLTGEKELYEILLRRNNQKLFRVIRAYIKDVDEVQDVMQNTYLKAFERLHQFKQNSAFTTWLMRIGINEALATIKKKGKIYSITDSLIDAENSIMYMKNHNQSGPEQELIRQESKLLIEQTIDTLEPKYKIVFIMKEVEGMRIEDIADCLELSESNVKVRLHRAKSTLKEKLFNLYSNKDLFEFGFSRCDNIVARVMKPIL